MKQDQTPCPHGWNQHPNGLYWRKLASGRGIHVFFTPQSQRWACVMGEGSEPTDGRYGAKRITTAFRWAEEYAAKEGGWV